jgi:uncharacterized protein YegP (UPF0339 family)
MAARYVISTSTNGKFHFVLKAGNNETILASQLYAARDGATQGIESVRANGPLDERFQRMNSSRGEPYFNLLAANGQVIGKSEMYSSERARDNGIESVKKNCATPTVDDRSTKSPQK